MASPNALDCNDVTVAYGDLLALSGVSVGFAPGLIHAVVGQNGAGKTTFARVAAGLVRPRSGAIAIDGQTVVAGDVRRARAAGVELVHQSFALPPSFTVSEAIEFGSRGHSPIFTAGQLHARWKEHLTALDVTVDPRRRIRNLPVETQQGVEIARALVTDAKVLILDEPTAVLSPSGIEKLFARVRTLKARGVTVILILHKIREMLAIADTVTVLRGGKLIAATLDAKTITAPAIAEMIIGSSTVGGLDKAEADALLGAGNTVSGEHAVPAKAGETLLQLTNVSTKPDAEGAPLEDVSLTLKAGEIVGVAGVEGNGQRTLVRAIAGLADLADGSVVFGGTDVTRVDLGARRGMGLRIIPFERNSEGLSLSSSLWENWSARSLLQRRLLELVNPSKLQRDSSEAFKQWDVRYSTPTQRAGSLSGGNAQKVIFARELDSGAKLILAAQPTRGLDIGATAFVWQALREARDRGCAILLISSDLDELFDISDRLIVMLSGKIVADARPPFDLKTVGGAMTGVSQ